jgi:hypothetical protein
MNCSILSTGESPRPLTDHSALYYVDSSTPHLRSPLGRPRRGAGMTIVEAASGVEKVGENSL